jgi:iron-sulfur cluster repair protein YtfE (RIC family)
LISILEQVYAELKQEHAELMVLTDRIRALHSPIGLTPLLEELHTSLIKHFSREQFPGGMYECMGAYGSPYHEELKILVRDHCVILSAVRALLERTRGANPPDDAALLAGVAEVLTQLSDHEDREHALADKLTAQAK